jgi:hypothetical protein
MSFNDLKRSSAASFEKLTKELSKLNTNNNFDKSADDRMWKPTVDKAGNGYAVIRFLPAPANEDVPFVRIFSHGFQGPGGWYIENSLTTIGQQDPIAEHNSKLWNSGNDADKETARKQKRRLNYYSNIYVVKDPGNPENEGKVFIFKYGKKIFDKINDLMNPSFEDEKPVNPFDLWTGANFKLKIRKFEGYPNYDKSEFDSPAPLLDDDDELEAVYKQEHSLQELIDKKNFKTYAELETRLNKALGLVGGTARTESKSNFDDDDDVPFEKSEPQFKSKPAPAPKAQEDDDDEDFEFFKKLAEED